MEAFRRSDPQAALQRFEELLCDCERLGSGGLPFEALQELARLYRRHSVTLARARERADDPEFVRTLNGLCVRAYTHLAPSSPDGRDAAPREGRWLRAVAATWRPQLMAWALLGLGIALGAGLAGQDPRAIHSLMPSGLGYSEDELDRLITRPDARVEFFARESTAASQNALFGSMLFANNTRVGLMAFASGALAGIPTALLTVYNGLILGALSWVFVREPVALEFFAWILPHGIPEFTAIALCAAAGLALGGAVLLPGRRSRRNALAEAIDPALLLVGTSLPFFVLAAVIESFIRESALGDAPRFGVAALMAVLVAGLLLAAWRSTRFAGPGGPWSTAPAHRPSRISR